MSEGSLGLQGSEGPASDPGLLECLWVISSEGNSSSHIIRLRIDPGAEVDCAKNSLFVYDGLPPPVAAEGNGGNLLSALVKLIYAFLWDEETIMPPFISDPEANAVGADLIPVVNSFANRFNDFTYYEENFQVGNRLN